MFGRPFCLTCRQSEPSCYCKHIQKFDPKIKFVILIHPHEVRRKVATGRMSYLCLDGAHLLMGHQFSDHTLVNQLIKDCENQCVLLYPGSSAIDISQSDSSEKNNIFLNTKKKLVVFIVDGTWATAKNMVLKSPNLKALPRVCFTPTSPSAFQVRRQPSPECYSTIEAIHHFIELVGDDVGFSTASRQHDQLITVFQRMVNRQLSFATVSREKKIREGTYYERGLPGEGRGFNPLSSI